MKTIANKLLPLHSKFFIGVNYWASHAGTAMWSDWQEDVVERDLALLAQAGIDVIRVFPLWPDFQPIRNTYTGHGKHKDVRHGENRLPESEAGRAGVSEVMMERFETFAEIAERFGIKLIVGLVTGWMSGRLFVPDALQGKPILTDPESIQWQVRFVRYFVSRMKTSQVIVAWDLGNECNEMGQVATREQAYVWTSSLANAIKASDSSRMLISGMHSLLPNGKWTMQDQGELTDILTTHPYPFWTPYTDYDPINTIRPIVHATAESLFYGDIGGKPCFAEEMGTMGPMVCSEEVAANFARASLLTQWTHGRNGLLWWCANDQTLLQHAPYDWVACEGELGLLTEGGRVKPALQELTRMKRMIQTLPIEELPALTVEAVCILNSMQDHWATALGSFLLAKQAGFDLTYQYENQPLKDAPLYLLPSITGVEGVPKQFWEKLLEKARSGASLYISIDDGYMLHFAELTGLHLHNRYRRAEAAQIMLALDGTELSLFGKFALELTAGERVEVLATEANGNIVFSRTSYGKGTVYFFAFPLELEMVREPGRSFLPEKAPLYKVYETISAEQRDKRILQVGNPNVGVTEHRQTDDEMVAVLINYLPLPCNVTGILRSGWSLDIAWYGEKPHVDGRNVTMVIPPNEASVIKLVRHPSIM